MELGQSKFDMGQRVWLVRTRTVVDRKPCDVCQGAYKQFVDWKDGSRTEVLCKSCDKGVNRYETTNSRRVTELWLSGVVCGVSVSMPSEWVWHNNKDREVSYRLKNIEWFDASDDQRANVFHEHQMHASHSEAVLAIQALTEKAA